MMSNFLSLMTTQNKAFVGTCQELRPSFDGLNFIYCLFLIHFKVLNSSAKLFGDFIDL